VRLRPLLVLTTVLVLAASACGSDGGDVTSQRVDQIRAAARKAGLADDVADVLALAARGTTARFQVTYEGTGGAALVVSQDPPNHRVDVVTAGLVVESQVVRKGVAYRCELPPKGRPGDRLDCTRTNGALEVPGGFTDAALTTFTDEMLSSAEDFDLTVEQRTIAKVDATCLIAAPKAGTTLTGSGPNVDTICLSDDGAQLLVDAGGQRVVATAYTTAVPDGTFDV
jgi:hypothetical protein